MKTPELKTTSEIFQQTLIDLGTTLGSTKLSTWHLFNRLTGGFRAREFTILCGSTGSGKTTWLANLSAQLLRGGVKHFVVNVETGPLDFMRRVLSVLDGADLNTGEPLPREKIVELASSYADLMLREYITFSTAEDRTDHYVLMDHIRQSVDDGCKIVFVDNLNFLMQVVAGPDQNTEQDRVTHDLIMLTKEIDVHLIMVMHPRKTDGGRVESEFDVKGSSTSVQEAHNVLLFNRMDKADLNYSPGGRELKIAKLRRLGKHVGSSIKYNCIGASYFEAGIK